MILVHRRDRKLDGSAPMLLEDYGGFQVAMQPMFRGTLYPWLERGGVFAMPNLRGGNEYGEKWHEDGMLAKKQNVFDDFVAAAEWLVAKGYARPTHRQTQLPRWHRRQCSLHRDYENHQCLCWRQQ